jgi:hypothetical protein
MRMHESLPPYFRRLRSGYGAQAEFYGRSASTQPVATEVELSSTAKDQPIVRARSRVQILRY